MEESWIGLQIYLLEELKLAEKSLIGDDEKAEE